MENATNVKYQCHDCGKEIEVKDGQLVDAYLLVYKDGNEEYQVIKCKECYEKSPALTNFRNCEVYSRVVGYLRPVQQWHRGKQEEFSERKEFNV